MGDGDFIPEIFYLVNVILAIIGFYIAYRVNKSKRKKEQLVCSVKHKCDEVVNSKYGKLFGIDLTYFGMAYYVIVAIAFISLEVFDDFSWDSILIKLVFLLSIFAALFSWYLVGIMLFKLKEKCDWCTGSAIVANGIAFISIVAYFFI